ncbi:hypothetical protein EV714DRAFT_281754 [Schizophyllum commune]
MGLAEREARDWLNAARRFFNSYKDTPDFDVLLRGLLRLGLAPGLEEETSPSGSSADLLEDCLTAILPLCKAPEVESLLGLYCTAVETAPNASRIPHLLNACNTALHELQSLQIPGHRFRDAAKIGMEASGCSNHTECKFMVSDANLVARTRTDEPGADAAPADTDAKMDANAKPIPKPRIDPEDTIASIFFSFKPGSNSSDAPPNEYTTKERTTQRQSKVNALRELDTYSVHGVYAHDSGQPRRQLNMRMGKVASQTLSVAPEMLWTISLLVLDSKALVCCIDREGIMHLSGIDITEDLPRFLLLLFALQRLPQGVMSVVNGSEQLGAVRAEHRGLQTVSAELLQPMVKLTSEPKEFVKGFFQITEAHYKAWINGVKHGDPTLDNLLYRKA